MSSVTDDIFDNHLDRDGAVRLRRRLLEYWHSRGFTEVQISIVPCNFRRFQLYGLRSNLVNGLPPSKVRHHENPTMERIARNAERERFREFLIPPEAMPIAA